MKQQQIRFVIGALALMNVMTTGCSSNSSSTASSSASGNTAFNTALATVSEKMEEFDNLLPNNEGASSLSSRRVPSVVRRDVSGGVRTQAAFGTEWDGGGADVLSNPRCSGDMSSTACQTAVTPKEWMGYQLDPAAVRENGSSINIFGRFNSAVSISCALMNLATVDSATGYPVDGAQTITFTAAAQTLMTSKCGFAAADVEDLNGVQISLTVTTPADTTVYDKKIVFELAAEMGGGDQVFYLRFNDSAINILSAETNENGDSRTIVALDKTTGVLKVEYFSGGLLSDGFNFYRLFYNEDTDEGRMFGYEGDAADSGGIRYTLSGKPSSGGEAALSMDLKGWGSGADWDKDYSACVTMADGTIATDNVLTCAGSVTGVDIDDAGLATVYNDAFTNRADTGWYADIGDTTTLSFDETTMFSQLASH